MQCIPSCLFSLLAFGATLWLLARIEHVCCNLYCTDLNYYIYIYIKR